MTAIAFIGGIISIFIFFAFRKNISPDIYKAAIIIAVLIPVNFFFFEVPDMELIGSAELTTSVIINGVAYEEQVQFDVNYDGSDEDSDPILLYDPLWIEWNDGRRTALSCDEKGRWVGDEIICWDDDWQEYIVVVPKAELTYEQKYSLYGMKLKITWLLMELSAIVTIIRYKKEEEEYEKARMAWYENRKKAD